MSSQRGWTRWQPLTGIAFVVCFIGSVAASSPPGDGASDKAWLADYATRGSQEQHLATGILLVFAALFLMSFLVTLWTEVAATRRPEALNPLPLVAAGVSAACIAVGGVLMGGLAGSMLFSSMPLPSADLLRFGNDVGFAMVGLGGMLAAALSIACLSLQAHTVGLFRWGLSIFGFVVAVLLLGALAFVPIVALLIWVVVVAIVLMRRPAIGPAQPNSA